MLMIQICSEYRDSVMAPVYWAQAAVFIAIGLLLRKLGARGPLEYVAAGASDVARSAGAVSRR
jgi:hypothetical protein